MFRIQIEKDECRDFVIECYAKAAQSLPSYSEQMGHLLNNKRALSLLCKLIDNGTAPPYIDLIHNYQLLIESVYKKTKIELFLYEIDMLVKKVLYPNIIHIYNNNGFIIPKNDFSEITTTSPELKKNIKSLFEITFKKKISIEQAAIIIKEIINELSIYKMQDLTKQLTNFDGNHLIASSGNVIDKFHSIMPNKDFFSEDKYLFIVEMTFYHLYAIYNANKFNNSKYLNKKIKDLKEQLQQILPQINKLSDTYMWLEKASPSVETNLGKPPLSSLQTELFMSRVDALYSRTSKQKSGALSSISANKRFHFNMFFCAQSLFVNKPDHNNKYLGNNIGDFMFIILGIDKDNISFKKEVIRVRDLYSEYINNQQLTSISNQLITTIKNEPNSLSIWKNANHIFSENLSNII